MHNISIMLILIWFFFIFFICRQGLPRRWDAAVDHPLKYCRPWSNSSLARDREPLRNWRTILPPPSWWGARAWRGLGTLLGMCSPLIGTLKALALELTHGGVKSGGTDHLLAKQTNKKQILWKNLFLTHTNSSDKEKITLGTSRLWTQVALLY